MSLFVPVVIVSALSAVIVVTLFQLPGLPKRIFADAGTKSHRRTREESDCVLSAGRIEDNHFDSRTETQKCQDRDRRPAGCPDLPQRTDAQQLWADVLRRCPSVGADLSSPCEARYRLQQDIFTLGSLLVFLRYRCVCGSELRLIVNGGESCLIAVSRCPFCESSAVSMMAPVLHEAEQQYWEYWRQKAASN
jgi:hypothetical protein